MACLYQPGPWNPRQWSLENRVPQITRREWIHPRLSLLEDRRLCWDQLWGNAITGQVQFHGTNRAASPCHAGSPPIQRLAIPYNPWASPDTTHIVTWNHPFFFHAHSTALTGSHQHTQTQNIIFYSVVFLIITCAIISLCEFWIERHLFKSQHS